MYPSQASQTAPFGGFTHQREQIFAEGKSGSWEGIECLLGQGTSYYTLCHNLSLIRWRDVPLPSLPNRAFLAVHSPKGTNFCGGKIWQLGRNRVSPRPRHLLLHTLSQFEPDPVAGCTLPQLGPLGSPDQKGHRFFATENLAARKESSVSLAKAPPTTHFVTI